VTTICRDLWWKLRFPVSGGCWRRTQLYGRGNSLAGRPAPADEPDTPAKPHQQRHKRQQNFIMANIHSTLHHTFLKFQRFVVVIIRPHRSTTYVDEAYCYRLSSKICLLVCLSVTIMSHAITAEPVEILFGLWTQVGQRNHVLSGGPGPP